jgi:hypothetical protein
MDDDDADGCDLDFAGDVAIDDGDVDAVVLFADVDPGDADAIASRAQEWGALGDA